MAAAGQTSAVAGAGQPLLGCSPLLRSNTGTAAACVRSKERAASLQKPAQDLHPGVKASRQRRGSVPALTMTHSPPPQASRSGLIRGCKPVTPVTAVHPFE